MDDDSMDALRYMVQGRSVGKAKRNSLYGKSILEQAVKSVKVGSGRRLRGTTTSFAWTPEPESYDSPWDAPICRKWEGRAEEFWDARLQGPLMWEYAKNGSTRSD